MTRWTVQRPDGSCWARMFATEATAWRVVVGGTNSERERRARQADMARAGWKVTWAGQPLTGREGN